MIFLRSMPLVRAIRTWASPNSGWGLTSSILTLNCSAASALSLAFSSSEADMASISATRARRFSSATFFLALRVVGVDVVPAHVVHGPPAPAVELDLGVLLREDVGVLDADGLHEVDSALLELDEAGGVLGEDPEDHALELGLELLGAAELVVGLEHDALPGLPGGDLPGAVDDGRPAVGVPRRVLGSASLRMCSGRGVSELACAAWVARS